MNHRIMSMGMAAFFLFAAGCAQLEKPEKAVYPVGQVGAVTSLAQFDQRTGGATQSMGKEIRLAGRVKNLEETDEGYEVLAKWLPYPVGLRMKGVPQDPPPGQDRLFLMHYHGKPKAEFMSWRENKFIMEGNIAGTKNAVVDVFGTKKDLLYVTVNCVHLWETGESGMGTDPDSEYSARERTLCVKGSK